MKLTFWITLAALALVAWFGFIMPYLVSSRDTMLVVSGLIVTFFTIVLLIAVFIEWYVDYSVTRKKRE